jgi:F420-0:gamma-glutamyl ligase-like protein
LFVCLFVCLFVSSLALNRFVGMVVVDDGLAVKGTATLPLHHDGGSTERGIMGLIGGDGWAATRVCCYRPLAIGGAVNMQTVPLLARRSIVVTHRKPTSSNGIPMLTWMATVVSLLVGPMVLLEQALLMCLPAQL